LAGQALHSSKVTLSWQPATDNFAVKGYRVYCDGKQIADVVEEMNSWLDTIVAPGKTYNYTVKAYDATGNLSADGNAVAITTGSSAR
jgi:chitinase